MPSVTPSWFDAFKKTFEKCDVILAPTVPMTAFENGFTGQNAIETYQTDICTVPVNIAGLPAVSIPCGMAENGFTYDQILKHYFTDIELG